MLHTSIPTNHPSFNEKLLSSSQEEAVSAFVLCGDLSIDEQGRVWRHRRKVGGAGPRLITLDPPVRAENVVDSGRLQLQVYVLSKRIVCLAARVVWFLANGPIPETHHIHHINGDFTYNCLSNLACIDAFSHISEHSLGREPPNKGTEYGKTEAYRKSNESRLKNHREACRRTHELWVSGLRATAISNLEGISKRQVYSRLRSYERDSDS